MSKKSTPSQLDALKRHVSALRCFCLRFPDAREEHPWGESAFKVNKKVFTFLSLHKNILHMTTKLPETGKAALGLPFAAPTGYGLGKSGYGAQTVPRRQWHISCELDGEPLSPILGRKR